MSKDKLNYLRTQRKQHALSTKDLAELIGQKSPTAISHYESGRRLPTLKMAFALEFIFGKAAWKHFPRAYCAVENGVARRLAKHSVALEGRTDGAAEKQRQLLKRIAERAKCNPERV